jgi:hypothetical protein
LDAENKIRITVVNRYYPPDSSVTAESASDLVKHLLKAGFELNIVSAQAKYEGGGASGEGHGNKYYVSAVYEGKNKLLRLGASIIESKRLIKKAIDTDPDVVIVMTSPPLLNYYASKYFKKKNISWIYWSLDLFPEAFKANGLIKGSNPIYSYAMKCSYSYAPKILLALGELQAKYLKEQFKEDIATEILPCGVFINNRKAIQGSAKLPDWKKDQEKICIGYIGNLGEAHSPEFLQTVINSIDPDKHTLVLVLYGSQAEKILTSLDSSQEGIIVLDYLPREELSHIDIHLASLKAEWVNICVPSKLVSAVHRESCFLFHGPANSDSWQYLKTAGWLIDINKDMKTQMIEFMQGINKEMLAQKKAAASLKAKEIEKDVLKAYTGLEEFLKQKYP